MKWSSEEKREGRENQSIELTGTRICENFEAVKDKNIFVPTEDILAKAYPKVEYSKRREEGMVVYPST